MELDELKTAAQAIHAPDLGTLKLGKSNGSLQGLVEELKSADGREKKRLRRFMAAFMLAGLLLSLSFLRTNLSPGYKAGLWILVSTYFSIVAVAGSKYFKLDDVDYAESTVAFLEKAEKRYRYIAPREFCYMIPLLIILGGAGWLMVSEIRLLVPPKPSFRAVLIYACAYLAVCVFGFVMAKKNWRKDKRGMLVKVREALLEFKETQ
jgi:hypothetical protein